MFYYINLFILITFASLLPLTSAYGVVGLTAKNDCVHTTVTQTVLPPEYQPGFPQPTTCKYPYIASTVQDYSSSGDLGPGNSQGFTTFCTSTLIYKDKDKAVFLSASHCPFLGFPTFMTFEPQPSIPYSSATFGEETRQPVRPYEIVANLIPVAEIIPHPEAEFATNFKDFAPVDMVLYSVDRKNISRAANNFIESVDITKFKLPSEGYLDQFSTPDFKRSTFAGVGYNRLTPAAYHEPDNPHWNSSLKPDVLIPAHHNRTYDDLDFNKLNSSFPGSILVKGRISQMTSSTCNGDSGGPLFFKDPNTAETILVGVNSIISGGFNNLCSTGYTLYGRTDTPKIVPFLNCAKTPGLSAAVKACVDDLL